MDKLPLDLPLFSQLVLHATHLFEVFHLTKEMLPFLPDHVSIIENMLQMRMTSEEKFFATSFTVGILKSLQSLFTFNMELITTEQAEKFLCHCLVLEEKFNAEVIKILELSVEKGN